MHPEVSRQWYSPILETTASNQRAASNPTNPCPGLEGQDHVRRAVSRSARDPQHSLQDRAKALPYNRPWPHIHNQPQSRHAGVATELHKTGPSRPRGTDLTGHARGDEQLASHNKLGRLEFLPQRGAALTPPLEEPSRRFTRRCSRKRLEQTAFDRRKPRKKVAGVAQSRITTPREAPCLPAQRTTAGRLTYWKSRICEDCNISTTEMNAIHGSSNNGIHGR
jgi:hypothetical protein